MHRKLIICFYSTKELYLQFGVNSRSYTQTLTSCLQLKPTYVCCITTLQKGLSDSKGILLRTLDFSAYVIVFQGVNMHPLDCFAGKLSRELGSPISSFMVPPDGLVAHSSAEQRKVKCSGNQANYISHIN
ncbi:hypothetical protein PanWU01x14_197880 [Parasponia andersonii]|uniref:Uncharacterized protein n=1 Tax=Parasponia andersonii TaxID=3476 RepID=A0A2P5BZ28_PARAD|nr:hypothetical protein PanWU01x14_197880 [Parasponia andersonii]